jgi:DNA-binding protein HU-beta
LFIADSYRSFGGGVDMAGKVMTKAQFVSRIAEKASMTKAMANEVLEIIADTAVTETKKNGQFIIPGIGKLVKSQRKARMGRNPQTGAAIKIPAKTVVKFRVAKACKDAVVPKKK